MNEKRDAEIIKLWNESLSAKTIGEQLGVTKNIVIGIITRSRPLGLITRASGPSLQERMSKARTKRKRQATRRDSIVKIPVRIAPKVEHTGPIIGIPFMELVSTSCRYPTTSIDSQHYFCGEPKKERSSYCPAHHNLCWMKLTGKKAVRFKPQQRSSSLMQFMGN
jgi:hypothetical protein